MMRTQSKPSFEQRMAQEAQRIREHIKSLPNGREREFLVRKARQLETAAYITEWLTSTELKPPQ
jgi:hypothetical protein